MSLIERAEIEANFTKTIDALMDHIRPSIETAFADMLVYGQGGVMIDKDGVRVIRPEEWQEEETK